MAKALLRKNSVFVIGKNKKEKGEGINMAFQEINDLTVLIEGYDPSKVKQQEDLYDKDWKKVVAAKQNDTILQAEITGLERLGDKNCAVVSVGNIRGYIPMDFAGAKNLKELRALAGKKVVFKVLEYIEEEDRRIFMASRIEAQKEMAKLTLKRIKEGDTILAVVQTVTPYRVIADIGGIEVSIPLEEIRHGWIDDLTEEVKPGDHLNVKVLSIEYPEAESVEADTEDEHPTTLVNGIKTEDFVIPKIKVSAKALMEDPWIHVREKYKENYEYVGTVSGVRDYGIFINFEDGIDGLAKHLKFQNVEKGDKVLSRILKIDPQNKHISCRIAKVIG